MEPRTNNLTLIEILRLQHANRRRKNIFFHVLTIFFVIKKKLYYALILYFLNATNIVSMSSCHYLSVTIRLSATVPSYQQCWIVVIWPRYATWWHPYCLICWCFLSEMSGGCQQKKSFGQMWVGQSWGARNYREIRNTEMFIRLKTAGAVL